MSDSAASSPARTPGLESKSIPNLRDIGGWATRDGASVRRGVVYRSTDLSRVTEADARLLEGLGLTAVVDLRTAAEREAAPDRVPAGVRHRPLDVLADREHGSIAAHMKELLTDAAFAREILGDGRGAEYLRGSYRDFVLLPSARAAYRTLLHSLLADDGAPVLVHCTTGKDRTGWAAAVLLRAVGVELDSVFEDYLLTNELLLPVFEPILAALAERGVDRADLESVLGVRAEYLEVAFATAEDTFGSFDRYVDEGLGLTNTDRDRLGQALLG
ncbi:tyrosine-protein phosphatase [Rhodococcus aetherivorans]|uniref:Tyrosine-protein phosphatase n=1 Tax=Rhodococcus aetherivorans TaxID=191292 RepID=A0AA46P107_9NOCA|nr:MULTISPECIES: tyrosine-protein phosphatase [Rhodococcus]ANZ24531.1 protein-tyrosine-phosphatase [Rhodococcus sp. WB1]UGQ43113.1 tyrosine-protein phosphatase [Rhodococcus aetherivorans]UYF96301.1 tyrosine-protein phosphatase [Rhodococcus aetherivorans]